MSSYKSRHVPVHMVFASVAVEQALLDAIAATASVHASPVLPPSQRVLIAELYEAAVYMKQ